MSFILKSILNWLLQTTYTQDFPNKLYNYLLSEIQPLYCRNNDLLECSSIAN